MICEKCNSEMENGVCPKCDNLFDESRLSFITEASDEFDAEVKISLLDSFGIKAYKRYEGFSAVAKIYCGNTNLGVKLYVKNEDYDKAKEIIDAPFDESELNGGENI